MGLHHLALGARNLEAVAAFYRDLLGLPEERRWHEEDGSLRSIWLDLGGARLMIEKLAGESAEAQAEDSAEAPAGDSVKANLESAAVQKAGDPAALRPRVEGVGAGLFLMAIRVLPEERERAEQRLVQAGFPIEERSAYSSYSRDPEGNRVALSCYPDA